MLANAKKIKKRRDPRVLAHFPEPKRGKVHWDFLLEEMQWMAKEFARQAHCLVRKSRVIFKIHQRLC